MTSGRRGPGSLGRSVGARGVSRCLEPPFPGFPPRAAWGRGQGARASRSGECCASSFVADRPKKTPPDPSSAGNAARGVGRARARAGARRWACSGLPALGAGLRGQLLPRGGATLPAACPTLAAPSRALGETAPSVFTHFPGLCQARLPGLKESSEGPRGVVPAALLLQDVALRVGRRALRESDPCGSVSAHGDQLVCCECQNAFPHRVPEAAGGSSSLWSVGCVWVYCFACLRVRNDVMSSHRSYRSCNLLSLNFAVPSKGVWF